MNIRRNRIKAASIIAIAALVVTALVAQPTPTPASAAQPGWNIAWDTDPYESNLKSAFTQSITLNGQRAFTQHMSNGTGQSGAGITFNYRSDSYRVHNVGADYLPLLKVGDDARIEWDIAIGRGGIPNSASNEFFEIRNAQWNTYADNSLATGAALDCTFPTGIIEKASDLPIRATCSAEFKVPALTDGALYSLPPVAFLIAAKPTITEAERSADSMDGGSQYQMSLPSGSSHFSSTPAIVPVQDMISVPVGTPIARGITELAEDCTVTDASLCTPDALSFDSAPAGATTNGDVLEWIPSEIGTYEFKFNLADTARGISSDPTLGYINVIAAGEPVTPSISPAPQSHGTMLGEPITIELALLAENCEMSDATACVPDTISFSDLPIGAVVNGDSFTWTPTTLDEANFTFTLIDSVSGATSQPTVGTIQVQAVPVETSTLNGESKNFAVKVGDSLTISAQELLEGCFWTDENGIAEPGVNCDYDVVLSELPVGAVAKNADGEVIELGDGSEVAVIEYKGAIAGIYQFSYRLVSVGSKGNWESESPVITSQIHVTPANAPVVPNVDKPAVTG